MNLALALFSFLMLTAASAMAGIGVDNLRLENRRGLAAFCIWLSGVIFGGLGIFALVWAVGLT